MLSIEPRRLTTPARDRIRPRLALLHRRASQHSSHRSQQQ
jgi:hypothetical protein